MVATTRYQFSDEMAQATRPSNGVSLDELVSDSLNRLKAYARDEPIKFALCAFGVGFVLGWKLKPW